VDLSSVPKEAWIIVSVVVSAAIWRLVTVICEKIKKSDKAVIDVNGEGINISMNTKTTVEKVTTKSDGSETHEIRS
jgi:hypothetical protein